MGSGGRERVRKPEGREKGEWQRKSKRGEEEEKWESKPLGRGEKRGVINISCRKGSKKREGETLL